MPPAHQERQQTHEKSNMHGFAGETCRPQKGGWPVRKSEFKSNFFHISRHHGQATNRLCKTNTIVVGRGQRINREFCGREQKKRLDTRVTRAHTSPGQATPTSHKEQEAKQKSKPQFPGSKGNAGSARLPPAHQERQQTHEKRQHARDCWRDLLPQNRWRAGEKK